ncbi:MAG: hypothetical protein A3F04_00130 [Candidatus Chisholmbacteria bacterium RIFCSPHIGHO2_12_FULL_49_9]|uniref:VTT domain-containing protein n=1 Tax=Candidatus Chisholmbacteria bacterium RIFCSPHIGHO2_01_FULL_52_32 TaxID=1797591 RepID=A0A1G1VS90_9BACT|nr:MAG: hypothetical protein A2786_01970 [Candidatus Chisholmbacteria bacterium RIFCSPHIGHO2_01_FULL_52_32]OGY19123.1 MAG: hypothetical protein A3F04_00130 [Candidatus Chisholmbacteria bacterium RIFCSPHIGHO2_12_FULL_49_9]OGY20361.1 MAG: hypothetical protein A2900_04775 [Candidatus Chisholmbacteria bacterium RIFCSPLOWO2_01_FULL_50_28]
MLAEGFTEFVRRHKNIASLVAVLAALVISWGIFVYSDRLAYLARYGYIGIFFLSMLGNATILLPMPSMVSVYIAGGLFNPIIVGFMASAGGAIGELTGYLAGVGGHRIIKERKLFILIEKWVHRYGVVGIFLFAMIPNPFFDMVGLTAGLMRVPVFQFLVATWLGQTVKFLLISYLGAGSTGLMERWLH